MANKRSISATVNTDASYSIKHKAGSFAYSIGCENQRYYGSGILQGKIEDVVEAELKAIGNGLHHLINVLKPKDLHLVYINTDNLASVILIKNRKPFSNKKKYGDVLSKIYKMLGKREVIIRHVPAHTEGKTKKTFTNNKLDEEAKAKLREHLKQVSHASTTSTSVTIAD